MADRRPLEDHVAIVVGATSGIGSRIAVRFAENGASVVVAGRRVPEGTQLAERLAGKAEFVAADVSRESDVDALMSHTLGRFGRIDVLVNCAGEGGAVEEVATVDLDNLDHSLAVHLNGVLAGMKYAAPSMVARGSGSIINVASIGGRIGGWTAIGYSAAKAAILQVTRSAAVELGESGVRVNSLSPGPIPTGIFAKAAGVDASTADQGASVLEPLFAQALEQWQPLRRVGTPDDVASAALFLAGPDSSFVTGHDLVVDGGISAGRPAAVSRGERALMGAALAAAAQGQTPS